MAAITINATIIANRPNMLLMKRTKYEASCGGCSTDLAMGVGRFEDFALLYRYTNTPTKMIAKNVVILYPHVNKVTAS